MTNVEENTLSGSKKLKSGSNAIFGLSIILFGQIANLLVFFYRPASDSNLEEFFDYLSNVRMVSLFVILTSIIGLIMIIQDLKDLLNELQKDRNTMDNVVRYLASEIEKK